MTRTSINSLVLALAAFVTLISPLRAIAADRSVFLFGSGESRGALIHDYAKKWVEMGGPVERFEFVETARSDDTIELLDPGRDVGLKVHAEQGELRLPRSTVWQPWQRGKWVERDQLPESMAFVPTDQKIRLIYFVPKDREPIPNYEQKIRVVMQLVADIYRKDLQAKGYPTDGFMLESNADGQPALHLIRSDKPAQFYNGAPKFDEAQHFQRVAADIPGAVGVVRRHLLMVFPETYEPGPAPIEWNGSVGRGLHATADGGLAMMSAWILRDEFCALTFDEQKKLLLDATPIEGRTALGPRLPNSPRFEFIEDGFGAVAHELGHALGLPHDYRQPATDLMGHGFRNLQVNYRPNAGSQKRIVFSRENSRLLGVSRYLMADTDRSDNTPPTADVTVRLSNAKAPTVSVSMKAADDRELRAAVFYDPQHDTVIGGAELKGRQQTVNLKLPVQDVQPGEFKLVTMLADAGGNIASIVTAAKAP